MKKRPFPAEVRIALLYALFGVSWILFSDRLLNGLFDDVFKLSMAQTFKGVGFVFASALLIYLLLHWELMRRRQAEEELQANELLFSKLFTSSPVAISMVEVPTGKNVEVNDAWCTLTGYTKEEVLGHSTVELNIFTPDERNRLTREFSKHGFANLVESEITTKNGAKKNILITSEITVRHGQQLVLVSAFDITERKQVEAALRLENERFQFFVDSNIVGIVIADATGRIITANDYYLKVLGVTRADFESGLVDWRKATPPEWLPADERALREADETGLCEPYEKEYVRTDGTRIPVYLAHAKLPGPSGQIAAFVLDITERQQAEGKIKRQLAYLTALREIDLAINSSSDMRVSLSVLVNRAIALLKVDAAAVLLLDAAQNRLNFAAGEGFRSTAVETASLHLSESYAGQAVREQRLVHLSNLRRERVNLLLTGLLKDEDFVGYSGLSLIAKGRVIGVLELFDRTVVERDAEWFDFFATLAGQAALAIHNAQLFESLQRTNAELEMRVADRTAELNKANRELERANQIKAEFLATMSHELRTPLNAVLGLSETLLEQRRGRLNTYQSRSISTIYASGQHLLELINDVLDLSKIEAGKFDYYPQAMEVESLCRASLAFVKESALRKAITLHYQAELPVPRIYADPRRLKQILVNLLTNAVKFTPEGGEVTLQVEQEVENDHIRFAVTDTGIGIAPEDLKRLFQPFMQVDSRLTREYEGTGLGLALVQRLTDLHGGSVHVESEVNKGSCFAIHLMMGQMLVAQHSAPTFAGKPDNKTAVSIAPVAPPLERGAILLAEDNISNVLMVGDYLEGYGYTVHVAHDGAEALAMAQAEPHDLILMDIQMPVMNGLETIQRLRRDAHFDRTPIIALTAMAMPGDRERCLEAGADEYLSKPVALKSLLQTVQSFLTASRKIGDTA